MLLPEPSNKLGKLAYQIHDNRQRRAPLLDIREKILKASAAQQAEWERAEIKHWLGGFMPQEALPAKSPKGVDVSYQEKNSMKIRDYETLASSSMRVVPSLTNAEEVLKNDKRKIRYPERKAVQLLKTLEMQQIRDAKQDETDEERRHRNA